MKQQPVSATVHDGTLIAITKDGVIWQWKSDRDFGASEDELDYRWVMIGSLEDD